MAYEELDTDFAPGSPVRAEWMNQIGEDFIDHEERIGDGETALSDHDTRLDALDGGSATNPTIRLATVTLTDAQIRALPTTGITIVAAPALNTRVKIHSWTYYTAFQHAAYGAVDATTATLALQTSSGVRLGGFLATDAAASVAKLTTVLSSTAPLTIDGGPYLENDGGTFVSPLVTTGQGSVDANALQLKANNNGAGDFTGGHVSNRLTVVVYYSIETIPVYVAPFGFLAPVPERRPIPRRRLIQAVGMPTAML